MRPIARVGDIVLLKGKRGVILTGSMGSFLDGRPLARVGDMTTFGPIISGSLSHYIDGRPLARVGDRTLLGGVIITGSHGEYVS